MTGPIGGHTPESIHFVHKTLGFIARILVGALALWLVTISAMLIVWAGSHGGFFAAALGLATVYLIGSLVVRLFDA